jgi:hypothetical protein
MGISKALVDLGLLPIKDIPQLPQSAREVLLVAGLVLEHLQKVLEPGASPWDSTWAGRHACGFGSSAPSPFHFPFSFCPSKRL